MTSLPTPPVGALPGEPRSNKRIEMPAVDPDSAKKIIESRPMPTVWQPPAGFHPNVRGSASNTVEGAPSIVELARALKNDPQLMFEFVYNNVEFVPTFGIQKGAFGALLDGAGNSFDQCALLIALLRQAGFTANYELGQVALDAAQLTNWLGITDNNVYTALAVLSNGGVPASVIGTYPTQQVQFSHCWVKVNVGTSMSPDWVVMDPSYKTYTYTTGINLATAMSYSQSTFLSDARSGYTIDGSGNWVKNMNRANIRSDLGTYADNLISWIKANNPTATMDDIVGGRQIVPIYKPFTYLTSLPYEVPGDIPTEWTGDVPTSYKVTVELQFPGLDVTFTSDQIYGLRLTWIYNSSYEPVLTLNGTVVATGTAQTPGTYNSIYFIVTHNAYPTTDCNQSFYQTVFAPNYGGGTGQVYYLIGSSFGPTGKGMVDYHQSLYAANNFANPGALTDAVTGEALSVAWHTYSATSSLQTDLVTRMNNTIIYIHHRIGTVGYTAYTSPAQTQAAFDIEGTVGGGAVLNDSVTNYAAGAIDAAMHDYTIEMLALQQVFDGGAASTTRVLDIANTNGTQIYKGTSSNWSTITPSLSGYNTTDLNNINTDYLSYGWDVLIPQSTGQMFDGLTMYGWSLWNDGAFGYIFSTYAGGVKPTPTPLPKPKPQTKTNTGPDQGEPVQARTGDFEYTHTDLTIGSSQFPYRLDFTRKYTSRLQYQNGPLGLGWSHNWNTSLTVESSPFKGLGIDSPIDAAAGIAELYITLDMLNDTTYPVDKMVICAINEQWWADQLTNNTVTVSYLDGDYIFTLLPDGSYHAQPNCADLLVLNGDGTYTYTTPQQSKINFNASGQLTTWVFPYGVTITLNYASGVLTSVSNGLGRTLTLNYTSGLLTSVSDGTGRSVSYEVDTNGDLIQFTDALSQQYTFNYSTPGQMSQYFTPANPSTAFITNTYDSLGRVESQLDALLHETIWYLSGPRSEMVDPAGNSTILYFNSFGLIIRNINALAFEWDSVYDGLQRLSTMTLPEGNSLSYTYDSMNNVLTRSRTPKSGSGLTSITEVYTYNTTYNKVHSYEDGNGNTTTIAYDPSTGNLLQVQRPTVGGSVPTRNYVYNSRGQLISAVDETGIQTQFNYDSLTEKMTSKVINTNWTCIVSGAVITIGDTLTISAHDTRLSGGLESVSYTVMSGDTLSSIASGLTAAINADAHLSALGIVAYVSGANIFMATAAPGNTTTYTSSTSVGATETLTLAAGLNLTTSFGYNSVGDITDITDARSNEWTLDFDDLRRYTQVTAPSPFSYITNISYDGNNNAITIERQTSGSPAWQTNSASYSVTNKLKTVVDPLGHTLTFNYDSADRLYQRVDAEGRTYQLAYDALNRLHQLTDPALNVTQTRTYTDNGWLYQLTDVRSKTTTYSYDGLDRRAKITYPDTTYDENQSYDSNNNVLTILTRSGNSIANTYDVLNRLATKSPQSQATVTYTYDLAGRLTKAHTPLVSGDPSTGDFLFAYDTAGRFYQETYPDGTAVTHQLDANANVTQTTWPDGYYVNRVFDQINRQTDIKLNGAATAVVHYDYDALSRRADAVFNNGVTTTYNYVLDNSLVELAEEFVGSGVDFTFVLNNVHQLTQVSASDDSYVWHPSSSGTTSYGTANSINGYPTVGAAGYSYNGDGCLTGDGTWTYGYDTESHLISASTTGTSASYSYDPVQRQAQKTVESSKTRYIYAGWRRIAEYDGSSGSLQTRYIYGPAGDEPVVAVSSSGTATYYHSDRQGNVIALSSSSGAVTNKFTYGPFGESAPLSGTTHGFQGQRYDAETGLYFFKSRYYSPTLGRFLQPDPIRYSGGLNLYAFVNNDPLNFKDPFGLDPIAIAINKSITAIYRSTAPGTGSQSSGTSTSPSNTNQQQGGGISDPGSSAPVQYYGTDIITGNEGSSTASTTGSGGGTGGGTGPTQGTTRYNLQAQNNEEQNNIANPDNSINIRHADGTVTQGYQLDTSSPGQPGTGAPGDDPDDPTKPPVLKPQLPTFDGSQGATNTGPGTTPTTIQYSPSNPNPYYYSGGGTQGK